jgi:hypothetical protein
MLPNGPVAVLLYVSLIFGVSTLLALWCGWGLARLTLPPSLHKWRGLLAPLLGYALLLVFSYWLVRDIAGIPIVLALLLPATGLLNLLAWRLTGPPHIPRSPKAYLQHAPLAAILAACGLVGVLPLFSYGYPTVIGGGWDIENYLPVSRYLLRGPISDIATAPANPLRDMNAAPPEAGLTLGFSIWQAGVDTLTGGEALMSFSVLMAWLRVLGLIAVYVLFRAVLGLARGPALLGTAFVGAGALFLWVTYFNFGMQAAAWPLIPLSLAVGIAAVQAVGEQGTRGWPALIPGALSFAAIPVAYYPALTLAAPLAAGLGLSILVQSPNKARVLVGALALGALAALFALPAIGDYFPWFDFRYSLKLTTLGIFHYVPLTDFVGLTPFSLPANPGLPVPLEAWAALAVSSVLMLVGLLRGPSRLRWLGLIGGAALYMLWLRYGQAYPYAWMKGGSYAAFPFLGLAASGLGVLARRKTKDEGRRTEVPGSRFTVLPPRPPSTVHRPPSTVLAAALLALMAFAQYRVVADHWQQPQLFVRELPALYDLRREIAPGSTYMLTNDPAIEGITTGLLGYMTDHATFIGRAKSGYTSFDYGGVPGEVGDYLLALPNEDPAVWGFSGDERAWSGGGLVLYERSQALAARKRLDLVLAPGQSARLYTSGDWVLAEPLPPDDTATGERLLSLVFASAGPMRLSIDGTAYDLPPGLSTLTTEPISTPRQLTLKNEGSTVLTLYTAMLISPGTGHTGISAGSSSAVLHARSQVAGTAITTTVSLFSPNIGPLQLALDVWDRPNGKRYGRYGLELDGNIPSVFTLTLDLPSGNVAGTAEDGTSLPLGAAFDGLKPGSYTGRIDLGAGTYPLSYSGDLFAFTVAGDGSISDVVPLVPRVPTTVVLADRPPVPLAVRAGDDTDLLGYALTSETARPGDNLHVTLWWRALRGGLDERSVLLHLNDATGKQIAAFDGSPANGGKPTYTWQAGEVIIDDHSLMLPGDLPPGDYSLLVGMYHYPSIELLPLSKGDTSLPNGVVVIPLRVTP